MKTETHLAYILIWLAILNSIWPILWSIRFDFWQRGLLPEKKAKTPKPLYTYPDSPDNYGYLDPIEFLGERIPVEYSRKMFLPLVSNSEASCQQGANLIQYNAGFEYLLSDPRPWSDPRHKTGKGSNSS